MRQNITVSNGLMLAEAVSYALVRASMSKASANQLVKEACQVVMQEGRHLIDVMKEKTDAPVDWDAIRENPLTWVQPMHLSTAFYKLRQRNKMSRKISLSGL